MSEIEISKILNLLSEAEIKEESWFVKPLDNLDKLCIRENEILKERFIKVEKEKAAQEMLKNRVQRLKQDILDVNTAEEVSKSKISELKHMLNETDNEIRQHQMEEKKMKQDYESRKMELGELENVKNLLEMRQSFYDRSLNTKLCCEKSNVFTLSFVDGEKYIGWVKFEYREEENYFRVVEIHPKDLVSDSILNKYHETHDSQGLLCYMYQNLVKT